ncbi:hypothetical protein P12x_001364 [Tundrisphaera lichenicola]|uniref:hypothetical protein n=1 Tax=Tundrisphaera lichenicola TaxID=2029860 RepID=UPI003EB72388
MIAGLGAGSPDVVRVRVPSSKVENWFPAGSNLQVLTPEHFEQLVREADDPRKSTRSPRILRATHSARWESGTLIGRSELEIEPPGAAARSLVLLEPWSPALPRLAVVGGQARQTEDGKLVIKLAPESSGRVAIDWQLRARTGSSGRAFSLVLPELALSTLTVELPPNLVPEGLPGAWIGPTSAPGDGTTSWKLASATGRIPLRLRDRTEDGSDTNSPRLWLEGTTQIDLDAATINWQADWKLEESPGAPPRLTIELDPGIELVDVVGPRVASFRVEPGSSPQRVSIRLGGEAIGPSPLTIRAICQIPAEGVWAVPSARPIDAVWTGGRTIIRLDPGRVLRGCVEKSARRVVSRSAESSKSQTLVFEPGGEPGPLAELTFRQASADATFVVRGHLKLGEDLPRFSAALTWTTEKGRLLRYAVDLPPGWITDRVATSSGEAVAWHADELSGGGHRIQMIPPAFVGEARSLTLNLTASAQGLGSTGPLDLPRVRPAPMSGRVVDEIWVATSPPGFSVRPILGRGLAWIDPPEPVSDHTNVLPWAGMDLGTALAWRWLVDDAEARVIRARDREKPGAQVRLDASVVRNRLRLHWTLSLDELDDAATSIPIHLSEPLEVPIRWKLIDSSGSTIESHAIDETRRASLRLPTSGLSLELDLARPRQGRIVLEAESELPWNGKGRIPLLAPVDSYRTRGLVAIQVEDTVRLRVEPSGPTPVDLFERPSDMPAVNAWPVDRRALMFSYNKSSGSLFVETTPGNLGPTGGLIREACLRTQVHPAVGLRHRLTLRVAVDTARDLVLSMPEGAEVDRIRRDGQRIEAIPDGRSFRIALPESNPGRHLVTVTIEYRSGMDSSSKLDPSRLLPTCSLACNSFVWELDAPEPWKIRSDSPDLRDSDPRPARTWLENLLGFQTDPRALFGIPVRSIGGKLPPGQFEKFTARTLEGESNLGDWLIRLDAGPWPIVVDRFALITAGWGPSSRINLESGATSATASVGSTLKAMGLVAVPIGGMILITNEADAPIWQPGGRGWVEAWMAPLRQASMTGADASDRFQSAFRWRGEPTPRALGAGEVSDRSIGRNGWRLRRFVGIGWPSTGASVTLINEPSEAARGWILSIGFLAIGFLARRLSRGIRALGLAIALSVTALAIAWSWPDLGPGLTGALRGLLAILAFWLGQFLRAAASPDPSDLQRAPTLSRSGFLGRVATSLMALGTVGLLAIPSIASPEQDHPILALFPFDGPPDPSVKPDRVVMLLEDHERLRNLGQLAKFEASNRVLLIASDYRVRREDPASAIVECRLDLEVEGDGPASWRLPIGSARDLSAEVDSRPTPITITKEGEIATIPISGPGVHTIRVLGTVSLSAIGQGGERLRHPIVPSAFAGVEVARDVQGHWVEVPDALGRVEVGAGGVQGTLGPVETLEVRWFATDRPQAGGIRGPVEATMLWDTRPVGDLLRVRLTHSDPDGTSTIRLAHEPGLLIRRTSIPGLVGLRREGTNERPEWVAQIDPPWPKDLPIEFEFWRPGDSSKGVRRIPRIEVPDAKRFTGVVGFRRPGDWSGRLEPTLGLDPFPDSSFVRTWGTLPDDGLTLAGSVRFGSTSALAVATGPLPLRRAIRSKVTVDLESGRLNAMIEAVLSDRQGRSFELELGVPIDFRVIRVEAAGLVDWQRLARDRIRIQFDGSAIADRSIRVQGYLPVAAEPVLAEARNYQARIPWPAWSDCANEAGSLIISGPVRFLLDAGEWVTPVLPSSMAPGDPNASYRATYRVEEPGGLGMLRWPSPRSRVMVSVRSDLTIAASQVTWTAVVDCEVSGGPAEALAWNLPSEWAETSQLEIDGRPIVPSAEVRGKVTTWRIQPESPIWRRARMVIRSRIALDPERPIIFPEVAPLAVPGRGSLGRYDLAIANVSGRPIEVAGSPGLQAIDVSQYRSDESPAPPGSIDRAYRVTGERWTLKITVGGDRRGGGGPLGETTRVESARLHGVMGLASGLEGQAIYHLCPRPGPHLALRLPESSDLPWASVDGKVAPILIDGPGRWLVVLRERNARRVELSWTTRPGPASRDTSPEAVVWPSIEQQNVPTSIRLDLPRLLGDAGLSEGIKRVSWMEDSIKGVEQLAERISNSFADFDRGSPSQRRDVLRDIVDFELSIRSIFRNSDVQPGVKDQADHRLEAARGLILESSQLAGLEGLVIEARGKVGLEPVTPNSPIEDQLELVEPNRVRRVGIPSFYQQNSIGGTKPGTIKWPTPLDGLARHSIESWFIGSIGLILAIGSAILILRPISGLGRAGMAGLATLGLIALLLEPLGVGLAIAIGGLGRWLD